MTEEKKVRFKRRKTWHEIRHRRGTAAPLTFTAQAARPESQGSERIAGEHNVPMCRLLTNKCVRLRYHAVTTFLEK